MRLDFNEVYNTLSSNSNLKAYFKWYVTHCESMSLPYHNLSHTLKMMWHIIQIYKKSQYKYKEYGFKIDDTNLYMLLLSALFHDYNHSGGKFTDDVNVGIAKAGLRDCLEELTSMGETEQLILSTCSSIIEATQYPYIISDDDLNIDQRIIRECDILVDYFDDYITHNIFGLMSEMKTGKNIYDFTAGYMEFTFGALNNLKLEYSKEVIRENENEFFSTVNNFSKLLI